MMTPPTKAMLELADEVLMKAMRAADVAKGVMVTTKWKDSIGIDEPSYYARRFAEEILRSSQNNRNSGEREMVIEECIEIVKRYRERAKFIYEAPTRDSALMAAEAAIRALKSGEKGS